MTIFQFIASLVASLAWPLTALILVVVFHGPILGLLEKVRQFELWGVKASFGEGVDKLAAKTATAGLMPQTPSSEAPDNSDAQAANPAQPPPNPLSPNRSWAYGYGGPAVQIVQGYEVIEKALRRVAETNNVSGGDGRTILRLLKALGKITPDTAMLARDALDLRDSVAHGKTSLPTQTEAIVYLSTAKAIARAILRDGGLELSHD